MRPADGSAGHAHPGHDFSAEEYSRCEVPGQNDEPHRCIALDEWKPDDIEFRIGERTHGLLLCLEIFRSEMEFAMRWGSRALLDRLKMLRFYPYSDLDRGAAA